MALAVRAHRALGCRGVSRRPPLRRPTAVHARGQHAARNDADFFGPRTGGLRRHRVSRPGRLDGGKRGVRRMKLRPALSRGGKRAGQPAAGCADVAKRSCAGRSLRDFLRHALQCCVARLAGRYAAACGGGRGIFAHRVFREARIRGPRRVRRRPFGDSEGDASPTRSPSVAERPFSPSISRRPGALTTLPWVRHASVRRVLPDTVVVEIVERRPLAIWQQHEKKFALIDEEGK